MRRIFVEATRGVWKGLYYVGEPCEYWSWGKKIWLPDGQDNTVPLTEFSSSMCNDLLTAWSEFEQVFEETEIQEPCTLVILGRPQENEWRVDSGPAAQVWATGFILRGLWAVNPNKDRAALLVKEVKTRNSESSRAGRIAEVAKHVGRTNGTGINYFFEGEKP